MIWLGAAILLLVLNIAISVGVTRSVAYSSPQKRKQLVLVWFLPLVGALISWLFLSEHRGERPENPIPDTIGGPDGYTGSRDVESNGSGGDGGGDGD